MSLSILLSWDIHIPVETKKKLLRKSMVESVACYGCEVSLLKGEEQRKLLALHIDYLRWSTRVSRLQKIPNTTIRSKIQAEQQMLDIIRRRQLKWYGHLLRLEDSRWPKKIYQWTPYGRRRRGRPQLSWRNQVTDFIKSKNMEEDMAEDRHLWRLGVDGRLLAV